MRNFICFIFMLSGFVLQAQVFTPGRLIMVRGDTLNGLIAEQGGINWIYKESKNSAQHIYLRKEILGYQRNDEKYEEHEIEVLRGKFPERLKDFLLVVEEGQVRLLRYDGKGIFGSDHTCYYLHELGMASPLRINVDPANFKVQMRQYFGDYRELADSIKKKAYGYDQIQVIVQQYNAWYPTQPHDDELKPMENPEPSTKPQKEKKPKKEKAEKGDEKEGVEEEVEDTPKE